MSQPAHMWTYWRDKKGYERALEEYFSETLLSNPYLANLNMQLKMVKAAIDCEMANLASEEEDE